MRFLILLLLLISPTHGFSLEISKTNIVKDADFKGMNFEINGTIEPQTNIAVIVSGPLEKYKIITDAFTNIMCNL